eukprot:194143_1
MPMVDRFMTFVFENVPWVDQQIKNHSNSVTISLQSYRTPSIIKHLNERKNAFCRRNNIPTNIRISSHSKLTKHKSVTGIGCKVVYFQSNLCTSYNSHMCHSVEPLDSLRFILKPQQPRHNDLICKLQSNNCRYEWIAHLDYVFYKLGHDAGSALADPVSVSPLADRMVDHFGYKDNHTGEECVTHFNFGEYLHYWRNGFENSVTPAHSTLKDELLNNTYSTIATSTYYDFYEQSYEILQRKVILAQDIGINNKKFRIPQG